MTNDPCNIVRHNLENTDKLDDVPMFIEIPGSLL